MIQPDQFEAYEAMILSDQIPAGRVCALLAENPAFAEWYRKRAADRRAGEAQ